MPTCSNPKTRPCWPGTPSTAPSGYTIEVDNDDQFIGATTYSSKTTSFVVPDPGPELTYFWRVRANFDGGYTSEWSATRSFNVFALPAPELI